MCRYHPALIVAALAAGPAAAQPANPNILLILSDDHSAAHVGCYGNKDIRTPNMDAFAKGAVRFERGSGPICGSRCRAERSTRGRPGDSSRTWRTRGSSARTGPTVGGGGVSQSRSTWAVNPESLPTARCWEAGITTRYEAKKSVNTAAPDRYSPGMASHRRWAVAADRSPTTIPSTRRVSASRAAQTHRTSAFERTKLQSSSASITTGPALGGAARGPVGPPPGGRSGRTPGPTTGTGR